MPPDRSASGATGQEAIGGVGEGAENKQKPGQDGLVGAKSEQQGQSQAGPQDRQEIGEAAQDNHTREDPPILPRRTTG